MVFVLVFVFVFVFVLVLVFVEAVARVLHEPATMNFRRLTVYQQAVQVLPLAAEIASALPQSHAATANDLLTSVVRMLSTMCKG